MTTSRQNKAFFAEFLDDFFAECEEHFGQIRRNLLVLDAAREQVETPRPALDALFRAFHSIKGLAGMVGRQNLERIAHEIESYLVRVREGRGRLDPAAMDILVAATDAAEADVAAFRAQAPAPPVDDVLARIAALGVPDASMSGDVLATTAESSPTEAGPMSWRFVFRPSPDLATRGVNVNVVRERLAAIGTITRSVPDVQPGGVMTFVFDVLTSEPAATFDAWREDGIEAEPGAVPTPASLTASTAQGNPVPDVAAPPNVVRVDLHRLDDLMELVGELVITRSRLDNRLERLAGVIPTAEWRDLHDVNALLERQLRALRTAATRTRLVSLADVFVRMRFVVRDTATDSGKEVRFETEGANTAIDKVIVDRIADPLLHLVRNAVAHGLEAPGERAAIGKPREGTLLLRAMTQGDEVVIEIEDDGRGVDRISVERQARQSGLLTPGEMLDDRRLLDVLCTPGFSTRNEADRVSGRGMGMAAVQTAVQALGGMLQLRTEQGAGTTWTLRLPLTLLIIDALIVDVGEQCFAVPLSAVHELIDVDDVERVRFEHNEIIHLRGTLLPLIDLAQRWGVASEAGHRYAMIVDGGMTMAGLMVDRLVGKREVVVRPLLDPLLDLGAFSGATELGDGRAVLIVDAPACVRGMDRTPRITAQPRPMEEGERVLKQRERQTEAEPYILFELAGTRYGVPSAAVQRLELVETITPVPQSHPVLAGVVLSRGNVLPVLSLRARFGLPPVPPDLRTRLIVAQTAGRMVGLMVDSAREFVRIAVDAIQPPPPTIDTRNGAYVRHVAIVNDRPVLLLDLAEVLDLSTIPVPDDL